MHEKTQPAADTVCRGLDCLSGMRNRYFPRKNLTADDFRLEQGYGIERRRLLNRAVHGWGVVYGFGLELQEGRLFCREGLALDRHGREVFRPESGTVPGGQIMLLGALTDTAPGDNRSYSCLLQAHYAERWIDESRTGNDCGCSVREWNHVCETVVFSVVPLASLAGCQCSEPRCLNCECPDEGSGTDVRAQGCGDNAPIDRGPHECLCHWIRDREIPAPPDEPRCWQGFEGYRIAVDDPVPLACVGLVIDSCGHPSIASIDDAWTPRRLVKNNDLLFDLFRGCDLTHIADTSWDEWRRKMGHRNINGECAMPWTTFAEMFSGQGEKKGRREPIVTGFSIHFSAPVDVRTLSPDCVVMTVLAAEDEGGWIEVRRVPITRLEPGSKDSFTDKVNICVGFGWWQDEIRGHKSIFHRHHVRVEIEVRGDLILDCHGQAVDANAMGLHYVPTGNGTPGGTYVSTFRVEPKPQPECESEAEG